MPDGVLCISDALSAGRGLERADLDTAWASAMIFSRRVVHPRLEIAWRAQAGKRRLHFLAEAPGPGSLASVCRGRGLAGDEQDHFVWMREVEAVARPFVYEVLIETFGPHQRDSRFRELALVRELPELGCQTHFVHRQAL